MLNRNAIAIVIALAVVVLSYQNCGVSATKSFSAVGSTQTQTGTTTQTTQPSQTSEPAPQTHPAAPAQHTDSGNGYGYEGKVYVSYGDCGASKPTVRNQLFVADDFSKGHVEVANCKADTRSLSDRAMDMARFKKLENSLILYEELVYESADSVFEMVIYCPRSILKGNFSGFIVRKTGGKLFGRANLYEGIGVLGSDWSTGWVELKRDAPGVFGGLNSALGTALQFTMLENSKVDVKFQYPRKDPDMQSMACKIKADEIR